MNNDANSAAPPAHQPASSGVLDRRSFLGAACLAVPALAAGVCAPEPARAAANQSAELATLLDLSRCIGCGACVEACREANAGRFPEPVKPFPRMYPPRVKAEDWSEKRGVDDRLTPYNWLFIQTVRGERQGKPFEVNIPRRCLHCVNPPCAKLCPWGAAGREDNGAVVIDADICLGGAKCRQVCPWAIPQRQTGVGLYLKLMPSFGGNGVMYKCDRCLARLRKGEMPACITACPQSVQQIGPRQEMAEKAKALAASMGGDIYGLTENGGTNTFYVSPVPFADLNAAIAPGPGRPHLRPVADSLAAEGMLAYAAFTAPAAGLAGQALRLARRLPPRPWIPAASAVSSGKRSWRSRLYLALISALTLTGVAQMPIFKRYYIADIPGLGWLDDFYLVNVLHYLLAIPFLYLLVSMAISWLAAKGERPALTALAWPRLAVLGGLAASGLLRVVKNLPGNPLGPLAAMIIDWTHLGLAVLLGLLALAAAVSGRQAYLKHVGATGQRRNDV